MRRVQKAGDYFGELALLRNEGAYAIRKVGGKTIVTGQHANRLRIINGRVVEFGEADAFYLNKGNGEFQHVPWQAQRFRDSEGGPMSEPIDFGLSVQIRDINQDGFPDIYVCNAFQTPDRLWLNNGGGEFREAGPISIRSVSYDSMGVDFADIDMDGELDFFVTEMFGKIFNQNFP